jgi:hypothetical protein
MHISFAQNSGYERNGSASPADCRRLSFSIAFAVIIRQLRISIGNISFDCLIEGRSPLFPEKKHIGRMGEMFLRKKGKERKGNITVNQR